jgi:hypothetical protein
MPIEFSLTSIVLEGIKQNKFLCHIVRRIHNLYSLSDIIRKIKLMRMIWTEHAARVVAKRNKYRLLVGKSEEKRILRIIRRMWRMLLIWTSKNWYGLD